MNDTMMTAFAQAKPAHQPSVRLVTRSRTGLRVWFDGRLPGRRFRYRIEDGQIVLEETGPGSGKQVTYRGDAYEMMPLGGPAFKHEMSTKPSYANGRLIYRIAVSELGPEGHQRAEGQTEIQSEPQPVSAKSWTERGIKAVLEQVRSIEQTTSWKLSHDSKTGLAVFIAKIE